MERRHRHVRSVPQVETTHKKASTRSSTVIPKRPRGYIKRSVAAAMVTAKDSGGTIELFIRNTMLLLALGLLLGNLRSWTPSPPAVPISTRTHETMMPAESPDLDDVHDDEGIEIVSSNEGQFHEQEMEISAHLLEDKLLELIQSSLSSCNDTETLSQISQIYFDNNIFDDDNEDGANIISTAYRGSSIFYDVESPQGKAFRWLLEQDTYLHNYQKSYLSTLFSFTEGIGTTKTKTTPPPEFVDYPTLLQRYILVVFFFATEGVLNQDYFDTDIHSQSSLPSQNVAKTWTAHGSLHFLDQYHECQWYDSFHGTWLGVKACSSTKDRRTQPNTPVTTWPSWNWYTPEATEGDEIESEELQREEVTQLFLPELGLGGSLPLELGLLTRLQTLDLQSNYLGGSIPVSIGSMSELRSLSLGHNNFVGTMPNGISRLTNLEKFLINFNNMYGENVIPETFCDLSVTGKLFNVWTDCNRLVDPVVCECCTVCCDSLDNCIPKEEMGTKRDIVDNETSATLDDDTFSEYYNKIRGGKRKGDSLYRKKTLHQPPESSSNTNLEQADDE